ncbi:glycosyl hydrolase family 95 catalytic domain-containing protein [Cohnella soli]|uniref:Glycoside hydrolase N-terminal domain-containing protein n=1 Tax=Cohnella soli TaxID=425005 RepID=A0ABW0HY42_9BACL
MMKPMRYAMHMKRPASWWNDNWREGTPLGNGLHGALMYGNTANERVMLTHSRLWREGTQPDIPDVSDVLPAMRELIFAGEVPTADRMITDALIERGYAPREAFPFPAADLNLVLPAVKGFSRYRRGLDMSSAEAYVRYMDGDTRMERRGFVSRSDDVVVVECHKDTEISLSIHRPDSTDEEIKLPENVCTVVDGEWLYFKAEIAGVEHGAVARVIKGDTALILVKLYTEGDSSVKWPALKARLADLPANYAPLFERHVAEHRRLFDACRFVLEDREFDQETTNEQLLDAAYDEGMPNALAERMWAYGRYLLISATTTGGLPCNLTGLWSGDYEAFWSFNMANINLQMTYWQALQGGLSELMLPVFDYYDFAIEDMKENARKLYGCSGIFLPAVTMPGCMRHVCLAPHITNWTAGAGWIAQHYYDYYLFTRETDFLEKRALPFMTEAAKFYIDFVLWQGDTWHVCPSVSPENRTLNYKMGNIELGDGTQSAIDATMDIAVIKELFTNLLAIGDATSLVSVSDMAAYKRMLDGAPAYQINEWGAPREWLHEDFPDNDLHRHQSHLYPMYPGLEHARRDEATTEIYRRGAVRRMTVGLSCQTSWSLVQNANMMARVKEAELALESLNLIAKSCLMRNLFTTCNDWRGSGIGLEFPLAPFQLDANAGWSSAVQEMLLFSDAERVELLPALPPKWERGQIGPLHTRCGISVELSWDRDANEASVILLASRDTSYRLVMPDGGQRTITMKAGDVQKSAFGLRKEV